MDKWLELLRKNDYMGVKQYLKNGADLSATNESGESVLACALRSRCDFDLLKLLIESGADIFDFDDEGVSIFDMAITYDNVEMVQYLIDKEIDVSKTSRRSGFTPLMAAACYGRVEIAKILIAQGVDQNALDSKGFCAADFARKMNKKSILALLEYDPNSPKNTTYAR
ncbi:MAG: ankyrin repeat domain-containing protein [Sulfurimonas sp.]|nr:ankyrin repeat domain-containing protein [Sulfurimonas sp.]MDD3059465.1 ankyrin repeat domain-containing protein [Sulfurimonas sp.]MDD5203604.1 ankyrin repeat domain-containing protein [Sulfurimonas sp.]